MRSELNCSNGILYADADPEYVNDSRTALNFYDYRRPDLYGTITEPARA